MIIALGRGAGLNLNQAGEALSDSEQGRLKVENISFRSPDLLRQTQGERPSRDVLGPRLASTRSCKGVSTRKSNHRSLFGGGRAQLIRFALCTGNTNTHRQFPQATRTMYVSSFQAACP